MTTTLTDHERTLLSAYRDGELSGTELAQAEHLLGASADARAYVSDLQALKGFSQVAFPAATSTLSSSAIQSAAHGTRRTLVGSSRTMSVVASAAFVGVAAFVISSFLSPSQKIDSP